VLPVAAQKRILVVDDNEPTQQLIARILTQELPVEVTLAGSAEEAQRQMQQTRFDVIVLDLLMPHASGFDVLEWMREVRSLNRDTPVLVVSVLGDQESVERCRSLGASVHIVKPILRETLAAAVREHLSAPAPQAADKAERTDPGAR
jgi:CheY-like chemotaxis protein